MKKVLSLVLVLAMVLSSMSFAFASNLTDIVDNDYEDAINTLVGLGIVAGYEDGTFRPEKTITRAEMAKLMVITLGYGDLVAGSKSNFADTQGHWADSYIALAAGKGIVQGDGNGKFRPDAVVSYDEAITMLVRGLGYTDTCNELKNMTWPTNFKVKAAELKLTKDVTLSSTGADRGGVAQLINNALKTALVTVNTDGDVIKATTTTSNSDNEVVTKYVLLLSRLASAKTIKEVTPDYLDVDSKLYAGDIVDLAPYMYQEIEVYENDDDEVVYVNDVESDVLVGEFRTATDDPNQVKVRIDGKNKLYTLAAASGAKTKVYYNGQEVEMTEAQMEDADNTDGIVNLGYAAATFVLKDDKIVGIIADKYTDARQVTSEYAGKTKLQGYELPLNDDDEVDYTKLTVTGVVSSLEDIQEDDVIVLFAGEGATTVNKDTDKLTIEVVRETVEGKITETNSDDEFLIEGTYYATSTYAADGIVEVGSEGTFFLDNKGEIIAFEESDSLTPSDYAVVVDVINGVLGEDAKGESVTLRDPQIKLVNKAGEKITYNIKASATIINSYKELLEDVLDEEEVEISDLLVEFETVIKYSVNSDKEITKITLVDTIADDDADTTDKSFVLASNVVIFNFDGDDTVTVEDKADLGDEVNQLTKVENKNGEIELLYVQGLGSTDTYALISSYGTLINDDDATVQKIVAYVDGVKVVYQGIDDSTVTSTSINTGKLVKLDLDGIEIQADPLVILPVGESYTYKEVTKVSGDRFLVDGTWYTLEDDASVYVLKTGTDDNKFKEVGDINSLIGSTVVVFDTDDTNGTNVVECVFVK